MASKTFVPGTVVDSAWLNDVNTKTYKEVFDVKLYGAKGDGVTDDTASIQSAVTAAGNFSSVLFPAGVYKVTSKITQPYSAQFWVGAGSKATRLLYVPTSAGTCVEWGVAANDVVNGGITGINFYTTEATFTKLALDVLRTSNVSFNDIVISGSIVLPSGTNAWSGNNSIGIRTQGHEATSFNNLTIAADLPIQIAQGINRASYLNIDIDHFNFNNLYLLANNNPCVLINTGVNLTQVSFTGYQAWVLGTSGLKWADTTTTQTSAGLRIENLRTEQGNSPTAYSIDISHNYGLYNVQIDNSYLDPDRRGIRLRKCLFSSLSQIIYPGILQALDVDATVQSFQYQNCFWQSGSTASVTGLRVISALPKNSSGEPLPPTAFYTVATSTLKNNVHDGVISATPFTVANNATANLGPSGTTTVCFFSNSIGVNSIFMLNGNNNSVYEVSDPATQWTTTAGNAGTTNVYWSAANSRYELENKTGGTLTYLAVLVGSGNVIT